ncbi:MAG: hypothetical protein KatS3mg058_0189 [Roseiflexus sp.]|nr:MAG: hypothetical protein KatS3mg058_0189 [Roseiflexus sp.]
MTPMTRRQRIGERTHGRVPTANTHGGCLPYRRPARPRRLADRPQRPRPDARRGRRQRSAPDDVRMPADPGGRRGRGCGARDRLRPHRRHRHARGCGAQAASVATSSFRAPDEAVIAHACRVAEVAPDLPIVLSIPQNAGNTLSSAVVATIAARCPNVVGLKDRTEISMPASLYNGIRRPLTGAV